MTQREFFTAIAEANITEELRAYALDAIKKLDAKNAKRTSADSKEKRKVAERRALVEDFFACHSNEKYTREDIALVVGLTVGQVGSACTALIKDGKVAKGEVKVGKSKKTVYFAVNQSEETED